MPVSDQLDHLYWAEKTGFFQEVLKVQRVLVFFFRLLSLLKKMA